MNQRLILEYDVKFFLGGMAMINDPTVNFEFLPSRGDP